MARKVVGKTLVRRYTLEGQYPVPPLGKESHQAAPVGQTVCAGKSGLTQTVGLLYEREVIVKLVLVVAWVFVAWSAAYWADAATFTVPLPVGGSYGVHTGNQLIHVDLGTALSELTSVSLRCEGSVTAGVSGLGSPYSTSFEAYMKDAGQASGWLAVTQPAGASTWPAAESFAGEWAFRPMPAGTSMDFLLDGRADVYFYFDTGYYTPEFPPRQLPSGSVSSASLIIQGTPIPEPGALGLLLAVVAMALRRR